LFIISNGTYQLISLFVFGSNYSSSACRFSYRLMAVIIYITVHSELMLVNLASYLFGITLRNIVVLRFTTALQYLTVY